MREPGKNTAFPTESFATRAVRQSYVEEFHSDMPLEPAVVSNGEPYTAHPAAADLGNQSVSTDDLSSGRTRRAGIVSVEDFASFPLEGLRKCQTMIGIVAEQ